MSHSEFIARTRARWAEAVQSVCGPTPASTSEWTDLRQILSVLPTFMGRNFNHGHLPTGGGLDLRGVDFGQEEGCLAFETGERSCVLIKPERLTLQYIAEEPAESFLYLHGAYLRPVLHNDASGSEEVVDLGSGHYVERHHWDEQSYGRDDEDEEIPLPSDARLVWRILGGNILIVCKGSLWNGAASYRGEHSTLTVEQIRSIIVRSLS